MDWLAAVEAAYALEGDDDAWLAGVVDTLAGALDRGFGVVGQVFRGTPPAVTLESVATLGGGGPELLAQVHAMTAVMPPEAARALARPGMVGSVAALLEPAGLSEHFRTHIAAISPGAGDLVSFCVHDAEDRLLVFSGARPQPGPVLHAARFARVAAHVGSGIRLRRRLVGAASLEGDGECVLSPSGRVEHAVGAAISARDVLRQAVGGRERARGALRRRDADEALALWQGLVRGRWSLVDRIESDGRRFVIAHRNDARVRDPRGLTTREARVAEGLGRGQAPKEIAYELGVSPSAVLKGAARARRKLGLASLAELAAFFAPGGPRERARIVEVAGERLAVAPLDPDPERLAGLTAAEREVARLAMRGASNAEIAAARGTSARTVANQMQRVLRAFGVSSRAELAQRAMAKGRRRR